MARAGLGRNWRCLFANDFDPKKTRVYKDNWGENELLAGDVRKVTAADLPGHPDLVWGSFPCQDLSLAGVGAGLKGERSGTFWPFWSLIKDLKNEERAPNIIVLENVNGMLTSHGGKDFIAVCNAFCEAEYRFGALIIDAAHFVPQSRPRLFIIGVRRDIDIPATLAGNGPNLPFHTSALRNAHDGLPLDLKQQWVWWSLPSPAPRNTTLADIIEEAPKGVIWHSAAETNSLLRMMSAVNRDKVAAAMNSGRRVVGGIYKRTRLNEDGEKVQRAEVRFDDVAGCLRTPTGGSSRQLILIVDGQDVRSRLISSRETARLMGLPNDYKLPDVYNEAYHLTGDGVAVPVVRFLADYVLNPIVSLNKGRLRSTA